MDIHDFYDQHDGVIQEVVDFLEKKGISPNGMVLLLAYLIGLNIGISATESISSVTVTQECIIEGVKRGLHIREMKRRAN
jgi:hypothetical protein